MQERSAERLERNNLVRYDVLLQIYVHISVNMESWKYVINHWLTQIIICIVVLILGHSLWNKVLQTFSQRRTRDLVNLQTQKYKSMVEELAMNSMSLENKNGEPENIIERCDTPAQELMMQMDLEQYMASL